MPKPVVKFDSPAGLFLAALKRCPDRPAFVLSGSSLSYREAAEQIARLVREMAALPGDSLRLRIADHGLWAMALIASELDGKDIDPKSPRTLQDSDLQQAIQSGPAAPLPAGPGRVAPASGCKDGDVFANLLPYSSPEVVREELCACLSVGGCLWFCEDPRGFTGLLSRIRPHCLVLDRAGLSALAESLETWGAREAGLDRLRRIVCTQAPTTAQKTALEKLGVSLETA